MHSIFDKGSISKGSNYFVLSLGLINAYKINSSIGTALEVNSIPKEYYCFYSIEENDLFNTIRKIKSNYLDVNVDNFSFYKKEGLHKLHFKFKIKQSISNLNILPIARSNVRKFIKSEIKYTSDLRSKTNVNNKDDLYIFDRNCNNLINLIKKNEIILNAHFSDEEINIFNPSAIYKTYLNML